MVKSMNCLWIILLLSCFGGCGWNLNSGCGSNCGCNGGRNNGCCGSDSRDCGKDRQRNRCRRAVDKAVEECGGERAVMRTLKGHDCDCAADCRDMRETRVEREDRMSDNNSCDVPGMNPPRWQDFPEVSSSPVHDDCGCND